VLSDFGGEHILRVGFDQAKRLLGARIAHPLDIEIR
jgi:hypothetical protein